MHRVVRKLGKACEALAVARRELAARSTPSAAPSIVSDDWAWAAELLEQRRTVLDNVSGVVGYGLGFRSKDGVDTQEPCIVVYVARKRSREALESRSSRVVPRYFTDKGKRIYTDVVQFGQLRRETVAGTSIGPRDAGQKGTIGSFATDDATGNQVAITAMHVTGRSTPTSNFPMYVPSRYDDPHAGTFGHLEDGTQTGVDAAKITMLTPGNAVFFLPGIGAIKGWRPCVYPHDHGTSIRMYGATTGFQTGHIVHPDIHLPKVKLSHAIIASIYSAPGDSGAAILDNQNLVLGFLVGRMNSGPTTQRVFCSAGLVLQRLNCDIPSQF